MRIIQRKVKVDRRKSASSVKIDIESELEITISEQTVRRRLHEIGVSLERNRTLIRSIEASV